jgi:hypothetical protein
MNGNGKKITLEGLYNLLFTVGVSLIMVGAGLIEGAGVELSEGLKPISLGIVLIAVGVLIYWIKIKEPQQIEGPQNNQEEGK